MYSDNDKRFFPSLGLETVGVFEEASKEFAIGVRGESGERTSENNHQQQNSEKSNQH